MENSRLLLAVILSVLIWSLWLSFFPPPPPVEQATDSGSVAEGSEGPGSPENGLGNSTSSQSGDSSPDGGMLGEPAPAVDLSFAEEVVRADRAEEITIETERMTAIVSNRGAQLVSLRLKGHRGADGESLEMVRSRGSDLYPFAIVRGAKGDRLNQALFVSELEAGENGEQTLRLRHSSELGSGEKVFHWDANGFLNVEVSLGDSSNWGLLLGPGVNDGRIEAGYAGAGNAERGVGYKQRGEIELLNAKKVKEEAFLSARGLDWITLEDNYFMVAAVPGDGFSEAWIRPLLERAEVIEDKPRYISPDNETKEDEWSPELMLVAQADGARLAMTTYFGAKRYSHLKQLPYGLQETVRWGFLGALSKPLYKILEWVNVNMVGNYGWAIVLVTILIKLVLFPLTHKSQKSMSKMQELNPKVQAVRNKYKGKMKDRQGRPNPEVQRQMHEEIMGIYRTAGVNPAGGCLPMLLQMPVFFAFYRLLTVAVELRGAPWLLWIQDLSQPDQWFVLPILMGVTSIALQKMMPAAPDPMQRRLMQMMPIMFTVFALAFPSGLVLYWLTNNILTMGQQAIINKTKTA